MSQSKKLHAQFMAQAGEVYARLRHLLCGKRDGSTQLTMQMPMRDWWTVVIAIERAAEATRAAMAGEPTSDCHHVWERRGDPCRADGYWYQCSKCGRFSR
jgi:predicted RNA-binding Zn-ribbon protein involved in translation (DUF1610 family)